MSDVNLDDIAATIERIIEREVTLIEHNEEGLPRALIQNLETLSKILTSCQERQDARRQATGFESASMDDLMGVMGLDDE